VSRLLDGGTRGGHRVADRSLSFGKGLGSGR
jgi:hypothetical protein